MSKFDLSGIAYDKNGNLLSLTRMGPKSAMPVLNDTDYGSMDVLDYAYHDNEMSNRLYKVRDDGEDAFGFKDSATDVQDYWYDANGNMTRDLNKGIGTTSTDGISYNYLNLPTEVVIDNGPDVGTISYIYDATGVKLRKNVLTNGVTTPTDYAGNYVYENGDLKQITQPEGYIEQKTNGWQYVYRYIDVWGNTRIAYSDDNNDGYIDTSSEIRREQNYYPFGLEHKGYNNADYGVKNNLKTYQGQEFTENLSLNTHEWRYRVSDPAIGRFWQVDPLAKNYMYNSTYAFQENKLGLGTELEGLELGPWKMNQVASNGESQKFARENPKTAAAIAAVPLVIASAGLASEALPVLEGLFIRGALTASNPSNQILITEGTAFTSALLMGDAFPEGIFPQTSSDELGQSLNYLFRGTTKGFKGGAQTIKAGVTPTSSNPAVATLYSVFNKTNHGGEGIVQIARTEDMLNSIIGSGLLPHDREVIVDMLPEVFSQNSMQISTSAARGALSDMGINIPSAVKDAATFDQLLKELPDFTPEQTLDFFSRVTGKQN